MPGRGILTWRVKKKHGFILGLAAFVCLAVGAVLAFLFRRLIAGPKSLPVSVDWINDLSIARYRPMERLLSEEDYRFLASQPGFDKKMLRRIRSERRKVFRGYLACLSRDFSLVGAALRLMMMYSAQDRPDLAGILYKQQALFALGCWPCSGVWFCTLAVWEPWMFAAWCAPWSLCAWNCGK
jgi:hypothetical protein